MSLEFFRINEVKGRKEHVCEQCGQPIAKGEEHFYCAQKFDGDFHAYREHKDCRGAWTALWIEYGAGYDDGIPFLREAIADEPDNGDWLKANYPVVAARFPALQAQDRE